MRGPNFVPKLPGIMRDVPRDVFMRGKLVGLGWDACRGLVGVMHPGDRG